jgi:hypothetical protein
MRILLFSIDQIAGQKIGPTDAGGSLPLLKTSAGVISNETASRITSRSVWSLPK